MEAKGKSLVFVTNDNNALTFEVGSPELIPVARAIEKIVVANDGDLARCVKAFQAAGYTPATDWDNSAAWAFVVYLDDPKRPSVIVAPGNPHRPVDRWTGPEFGIKRFSALLAKPSAETAFLDEMKKVIAEITKATERDKAKEARETKKLVAETFAKAPRRAVGDSALAKEVVAKAGAALQKPSRPKPVVKVEKSKPAAKPKPEPKPEPKAPPKPQQPAEQQQAPQRASAKRKRRLAKVDPKLIKAMKRAMRVVEQAARK